MLANRIDRDQSAPTAKARWISLCRLRKLDDA